MIVILQNLNFGEIKFWYKKWNYKFHLKGGEKQSQTTMVSNLPKLNSKNEICFWNEKYLKTMRDKNIQKKSKNLFCIVASYFCPPSICTFSKGVLAQCCSVWKRACHHILEIKITVCNMLLKTTTVNCNLPHPGPKKRQGLCHNFELRQQTQTTKTSWVASKNASPEDNCNCSGGRRSKLLAHLHSSCAFVVSLSSQV